MSNETTVMMMLTCGCGQKMKVPTTSLGKSCRCVKCGERVIISPENTKPIALDVVAKKAETHASPAPPAGTAPPEPAAAGPATGEAPEGKRIGAMLIEQGLITPEHLKEALTLQKERGGKTFELLIERGHLDKKALHEFLSRQPGVASIDLANYELSRDIIALIPKEFAIAQVLLPIDKLGRLLTVAMACPLDTASIKAVEQMTGLRVKAMLCKLDDIHAAVKKYYPPPADQQEPAEADTFSWLKTTAKTEKPDDLAPLLAQLDSLPASTDILAKVKKATSTPQCGMTELIQVVSSDPALAAKLISMANSGAYGLGGRVDTLGLALALLGAAGAREVAAALESAADGKAGGFDAAKFRRQSVLCAEAAQAIAKVCAPGKAAAAYTAGLLHEIGSYALACAAPDRYAKVNSALTGEALLRIEKQTIHITHAEAGYLLAGKWRFPATLADAIRYHHSPEKADNGAGLVAVVALASVMAEATGPSGEVKGDIFESCGGLLQTLSLDKAAAQRILTESAVRAYRSGRNEVGAL